MMHVRPYRKPASARACRPPYYYYETPRRALPPLTVAAQARSPASGTRRHGIACPALRQHCCTAACLPLRLPAAHGGAQRASGSCPRASPRTLRTAALPPGSALPAPAVPPSAPCAIRPSAARRALRLPPLRCPTSPADCRTPPNYILPVDSRGRRNPFPLPQLSNCAAAAAAASRPPSLPITYRS